jgi:hypothetical protein
MSAVGSLVDRATEPACACLWKNRVTGWVADFNAFYEKVKRIDFGIDQGQSAQELPKNLDEAYSALKQVDNLVNAVSFLEAPDTSASPDFPLLKRHAMALKAAIVEMTSEPRLWSSDMLSRLLEIYRMVTLMSNGRPNIQDIVCDHLGFLRGTDEAPDGLEDATLYPYRTRGKVAGVCPTCRLKTEARINKRSIDRSFFEKDPRCVRIRVRNGALRKGEDDACSESYVQASFFRADSSPTNQGSQWTYTVNYSLAEGANGEIGAAADVEAWSRNFGTLPKELVSTFRKEIERHHDTLVETVLETKSRLSLLRPESSPHEVFAEICGPVLALADLLERLSAIRTDTASYYPVR